MEEIDTPKLKNRDGEKGAAMVMVLLISFLLLIASAGILLESSMNTANVSDATADQQAYGAAESGIQSALNVLRGNVKANPQFDTTKLSSSPVNRIDYIKALKLDSSNLSAAESSEPRLSRWGLKYTNDRVSISETESYRISLSDPDSTSVSTTYNTVSDGSGIYDTSVSPAVYKLAKTFGNGTSTATIAYNPETSSVVKFADGNTGSFGNFQVSVPTGSAGADIPETRFQIVVNMTNPYKGTRSMYGIIKAGRIQSGSVTASLEFYSPAFILYGSTLTLAARSIALTPPNVNGGKTPITGSMTPVEPQRILISSTGFGPRGARKQLEAMVQKSNFNGLSAPAALTMVGSSTGFVFDAGNSINVLYSGDDYASSVNIPSIGVTNAINLKEVNDNLPKTAPNPPPTDVTYEMPDWLLSPAKLDAQIKEYFDVAVANQRIFGSNGLTAPNFGDNFTATGITFIDGDASFSGSGGGILICTGKLTLNGGVDFNGLIIVTGAGGFDRSGGGGGSLQGNTVIAPYAKSRMYKSDGKTPADKDGIAAASFLGPKYDISGGGNSELRYNSSSVDNGLTAVSNIVLGVAEK